MGLHIRDERQLKALTVLSQAQVDQLLPVFSEVYTDQQQQKYAADFSVSLSEGPTTQGNRMRAMKVFEI